MFKISSHTALTSCSKNITGGIPDFSKVEVVTAGDLFVFKAIGEEY